MGNRVLIADDDESILWVLKRFFVDKGFDVAEVRDGKAAFRMLRGGDFSLAVMDIRMPAKDGLSVLKALKRGNDHHIPVIVMTAQATMNNAIEAMKSGAFDYITKPFDLDELEVMADKAVEYRKLKGEVSILKDRLKERWERDTVLIGKSRAIQEIFKTVGRVAAKDVTVLIQGESGTGKELLAKLIHINSHRSEGPFVALNTAAIPKDLMESELFGFEKGAFTGAMEVRKGKFELADGGTLFLDEIGDMSLELQGKLLRAVQEREFYVLGGKKPTRVDVRIVAATNQDLEKAVEENRFREDLLYRLNVITIKIPPLKSRKEDIPLLIDYFLKRFREEMGMEPKEISPKAMDALKRYSWPGNVRELENILRRATLLSRNPVLSVDDLALPSRKENGESIEVMISRKLKEFVDKIGLREGQELYGTVIPFMERPLIKLLLKRTGGNQLRTAALLGINRNTLRKKIKELGIDIKDLV